MRLFATILLCALGAAPQQVGQNAPITAKPQLTVRTSTQLVVETVVVKDANGKSVEGLTANDFTVTEDGAAQEISFFEFQRLPEAADSAPLAEPGRPQASSETPSNPDLAGSAGKGPLQRAPPAGPVF